MPLSQLLIPDTDDLYVPDYKFNIYKVLPTALRCMGVQIPRNSLFRIPEVRNHLKKNKALDAERVIVCLVDSLGFQNIQGTAIESFIQNLNGLTLSSTFPSITSAAVTSIHLGVPPTAHGILGQTIYFQEYGTLVDTLRMAGNKTRYRDAIPRAGINVRRLLWCDSISNILRKRNPAVVYADGLPGHIAGTGLGHFFTSSSNILPYQGFIDAFGMTRRTLDYFEGHPLFITLYFGILDTLAHKYGPYSNEYRAGCDSFLRQLKAFIQSLSASAAKKTTIVICSDHGQNTLQRERALVFTKEELEEVNSSLLVPPGHSGRVTHLYCKSARKRAKLKSWFEDRVEDRALVLNSKDIVKSRLLPVRLTHRISQRLGDLLLIFRDGAFLIIERDEESEWSWGLLPNQGLIGQHGSLTADELYTPFLAFNAQMI